MAAALVSRVRVALDLGGTGVTRHRRISRNGEHQFVRLGAAVRPARVPRAGPDARERAVLSAAVSGDHFDLI